MPATPTADDLHRENDLARQQRRDPRPLGEERIRARVLVTGVYSHGPFFLAPDSYQPHPTIPIMCGEVTIEGYTSQVEELRALSERLRPSDREIERAMDDLRRHIGEIAADGLEGAARDAAIDRVERATGPELLALLTGGRLAGKTHRPYRPSWGASFYASNHRDCFPVLSVEVAP